MSKLNALLAERILVLDGAMGTMLQQYGFSEADFRGDRFGNHTVPLAGNNDLLFASLCASWGHVPSCPIGKVQSMQ